MTGPGRVVWQGRLPLWLVLLAGLPLLVLLLFSVAVAGVLMVGAGLLAALALPRLGTRARGRAGDDRTIELQSSEYRRLPHGDDER